MWPSVPVALPAWRPLTGVAITATSVRTMSHGREGAALRDSRALSSHPRLKNFANSASEVFNVVVSNFSPATMVTVRAKAGNAQETYNFLLSQSCGLPTPTRRIYWTNVGTDTIGRTNPKTQNINQSFINTNDVPLWRGRR